MTPCLALDTYRLLGRSGLRVSPFALGTMTFGTDWGWGADETEARLIFDAYVDRGGNFIDTANAYTGGTSETFVGRFVQGRRDRLVLATKYSMTSDPTDPNAGGNGRKSMIRSIEASLRRLGTDYIDLFYLHAWDFTTSPEEVMRGLDDLVRSGKVLYVGLSDITAWQAARMQTLAELRGWAPLIALQIEYSLIERTVERDLIPMARDLGFGVVPWSPLASGVLTGKYRREDLVEGDGNAAGSRKNLAANAGALTERGLLIADAVKAIAEEVDKPPSQVALAWVLNRPGVVAPILGARTLNQFEDNLAALEVSLNRTQLERLDAVSAVELGFPHAFLASAMVRNNILGEAKILTPAR